MRTPLRAIGVGIAVVLVAALLWTPSAAAPAVQVNNLGLRTIAFKILNNTGRQGNLFLFVFGQVPSQGGKTYYLSDTDGNVTIIPQLSTLTSLALNLGSGDTLQVTLPELNAARIYFSISKPVRVTAGAEGAIPNLPSMWDPNDESFNIFLDYAEFTWLEEPSTSMFKSSIGMNFTQLDGVGIPLLFTLKGKLPDGTVVKRNRGFSNPASRAGIIKALKDAGEPWNKLIIGPNRTYPLRVISPYHGMEIIKVIPDDFLANYIKNVWTTYGQAGNALVGTAEGRTYKGKLDVDTNRLTFKQDGGSDPDPPFSYDKPNTYTAFTNGMLAKECPPPPPNTQPTPPCRRAGVIGTKFQGALMRTTLLINNNLDACTVSQFYTDAPVNEYAKAIHQYAVKNLAYAFGFDDSCEQSSFILIFDPTLLIVTLQPFD